MSSSSQPETPDSLSFFLPFVLGLTRPDPDQDSANQPDPQTQTEQIILLNPFIQSVVVIGGGGEEKPGRPPATREAIEAMPVVEIDEGEVGECPICLEEWGGGVVKETPCKHRFHGECVERWMGVNGSCPVCRFQMPCDDGRKRERESGGGDGDGGERRVWVSFSFGGGGGRRSSVGGPDGVSS